MSDQQKISPILPRPCGATRPALPGRNAGWECTGRDLIVVFTAKIGGFDRLPLGIPVVLPARALVVIEPEDWWDLPVQRFAGGDHLHLCVLRRPTEPFETDTTLVFGSTAEQFKNLGPIIDGGALFIGGPA